MNRAAVLTSAAAALAALSSTARAQSKPFPIKVGISAVESYGEPLYAQAQAFFQENGLAPEGVTLGGAGAPLTLAVISGSLDTAVANIGSIASAHLRGLGIYLIAPCGLYSSTRPTTVLGTAKTSVIRTAKDLEGKTVGVTSLRDLQQASVMNWIDASGGEAKNTTFVEVSSSQMTGAVVSNRIAAGVFVEPVLTTARADIRILATPYDSVAKSLLISGWIANKNWYDTNHDAAERLLSTIRRTAHWANQNHTATAAILAEHAKIAPETIAKMTRITYADERSFASIQPVIDVMAKYGFLQQSFRAADLFPPNLNHEGRI